MSERAGFRPDIEGLRGVAVLLVVVGHLTGWPRGGFVGVDVFFVISGFLITGLLVGERERTGRLSLPRFYLRRARRLLPAGVLALVVTDLAATLLLLPSPAHATLVDSAWAAGFLANVRFAAIGTDYFSLTRAPSAVQHYWSLSVEEQFYLLWPCLVAAAFAVGRRRAVAWLAGLAIALSLTWSVLSTAHTPGSAYFSSPARAWELGAGALLVLLGPRLPGWVGWLGGAGLLASVALITPSTPVPGYALVLPVLSTVAILGAGGSRLGLGLRPIRYVGAISYSLYLWHWPVIVLGGTLRGGTTPLAKTALLGLALLLSVASYQLVERVFRYRRPAARRPRHARRRAAALSYAIVLVGALVATWVFSGSTPAVVPVRAVVQPGIQAADLTSELRAGLALQQWPSDLEAKLADAGAPEWIHDRCLDVSAKNARRCVYGPQNAPESVALLGDSVGVSWMPALRRAADIRGARVHVLTRRQCPNVRRFVSPSCTEHQDWAIRAVQQLQPELVVLSARYEGPATPEQWREGLTRMIAAVAPFTRHVVVLAPPPDTANLQSCYTRSSTPSDCVRPVSQRWTSYTNAERAAAAAGHADFVDPGPWFCVQDRCPAVVADLPVMFDGRHLAAEFATRLTPQMERVLAVS
ncbi:MAG: SGNH hydrolase domain-containing protein [Mycobacteriales bacterium]